MPPTNRFADWLSISGRRSLLDLEIAGLDALGTHEEGRDCSRPLSHPQPRPTTACRQSRLVEPRRDFPLRLFTDYRHPPFNISEAPPSSCVLNLSRNLPSSTSLSEAPVIGSSQVADSVSSPRSRYRRCGRYTPAPRNGLAFIVQPPVRKAPFTPGKVLKPEHGLAPRTLEAHLERKIRYRRQHRAFDQFVAAFDEPGKIGGFGEPPSRFGSTSSARVDAND
jgi:hypothetical protein